ncbi:hypothetical protein HK101_005480 [Irineochytrium annulatum]|nr:hypothetical protein HK101_005480 [Irineochytrium annulatum]
MNKDQFQASGQFNTDPSAHQPVPHAEAAYPTVAPVCDAVSRPRSRARNVMQYASGPARDPRIGPDSSQAARSQHRPSHQPDQPRGTLALEALSFLAPATTNSNPSQNSLQQPMVFSAGAARAPARTQGSLMDFFPPSESAADVAGGTGGAGWTGGGMVTSHGHGGGLHQTPSSQAGFPTLGMLMLGGQQQHLRPPQSGSCDQATPSSDCASSISSLDRSIEELLEDLDHGLQPFDNVEQSLAHHNLPYDFWFDGGTTGNGSQAAGALTVGGQASAGTGNAAMNGFGANGGSGGQQQGELIDYAQLMKRPLPPLPAQGMPSLHPMGQAREAVSELADMIIASPNPSNFDFNFSMTTNGNAGYPSPFAVLAPSLDVPDLLAMPTTSELVFQHQPLQTHQYQQHQPQLKLSPSAELTQAFAQQQPAMRFQQDTRYQGDLLGGAAGSLLQRHMGQGNGMNTMNGVHYTMQTAQQQFKLEQYEQQQQSLQHQHQQQQNHYGQQRGQQLPHQQQKANAINIPHFDLSKEPIRPLQPLAQQPITPDPSFPQQQQQMPFQPRTNTMPPKVPSQPVMPTPSPGPQKPDPLNLAPVPLLSKSRSTGQLYRPPVVTPRRQLATRSNSPSDTAGAPRPLPSLHTTVATTKRTRKPRRSSAELRATCIQCQTDIAVLLLHADAKDLTTPYRARYTCASCVSVNNGGPAQPTPSLAMRKRGRVEDGADAECRILGRGGCCIDRGGSGAEEGADLVRGKWEMNPAVMVEPVCMSCHAKYAFCTACGAGGQYRIGKWRPREMFHEGRRCCSLSHVRVQNLGKEGVGVEDGRPPAGSNPPGGKVKALGGAAGNSGLWFETFCVEEDLAGEDAIRRLVAGIKAERIDSLLTDVAIPPVMERAKGYGRSYASIIEFQSKSTLLLDYLLDPPRPGRRRYVRMLNYDLGDGRTCVVAYVVAEWDMISRWLLLETMYDRRGMRTGKQYECRISSDSLSGLLGRVRKDASRLTEQGGVVIDPPLHCWLWALRHKCDSIGQAMSGAQSRPNAEEAATDATDFSLRRLGFRPLAEHVDHCAREVKASNGKPALPAIPVDKEVFTEHDGKFVVGPEKQQFTIYAADTRGLLVAQPNR